MNYVIGFIIGAAIVLFVPLTLPTLIGVACVAAAIYVMPEGWLAFVLAVVLLWVGFHMLF
jgi:hypothetical protein